MARRSRGPDLESIPPEPADAEFESSASIEHPDVEHPRRRRNLPVLVSAAALVLAGVALYTQADLRHQRNNLRARLAETQRVADALAESNHDLQNAGKARYVGGDVLALSTTGTLKASMAVVSLEYPRAAQPQLWILVDVVGADPKIFYTVTASACAGDAQYPLQGGYPVEGRLQLGATDVNLRWSQGPYTVILRGDGEPLAGISIARDSRVSVLPAGHPGC